MDNSELNEYGVDKKAFRVGMIYCFCEMIDFDVKKLALSAPLTPDEYEALRENSGQIVEEFGLGSYADDDFLTTDLFDSGFTRDKVVILYFKDGKTLDEYLALKERKRGLLDKGAYSGKERESIAREFGRLLSYPEARIDGILARPPKSPGAQ